MKRVLAAVAAIGIAGAGWSSAVAASGPASPPFATLKVIVQWAGQTEPVEVNRVGDLIQQTEVLSVRPGGSTSNFTDTSPGVSSLKPITLERGLSKDLSFAHWAAEPTSASDFRRDMIVTLLDQQSNPVVFIDLAGCWVSAYRAFSELDANGAPVSEQLTLQCDRWTRRLPPQ